MKPADRFSVLMTERGVQFARRALQLRYEFSETTAPASVIEGLLMAAYIDGARDVYSLVDDELQPLMDLIK